MDFTVSALKGAGFEGWVAFDTLRAAACPTAGGVYVVVQDLETPPIFAATSCGGWFKGKDPSVPREALAANWVEGATVVYIGKADNLKRRLTQYADFGAGKPVGHWGGRLIWQLSHCRDLRVAWRETPGHVPVEVEAELLAQFQSVHGKPPFANNPHRLGM